MTRGLFVAFEGGDGVGKSTQIALLADRLHAAGETVVATREPGGTPLGIQLRRLVLDPDGYVTPRAEALIYAADRAHHVDTVIRPALEAGQVVLTDRYVDSTLAYQGAGRGLRIDDARVITTWATGGLTPALTVLLDLDPTVGLARAEARAEAGAEAGAEARADSRARPDRLEAASLQFHKAVRAGFLALAAAQPARYLVVDAALAADDIAARVQAAIAPLLPLA